MSGPRDPNRTSGPGLVLRDSGEETGNPMSAPEERRAKGPRPPARFWLALAALLLGLATLALGFIFFSSWPGVLAAEVFGAGAALLATSLLLLTGGWRTAATAPISATNASAAVERQAPSPPADTLAPPDTAPTDPPPSTSATATKEPPTAEPAPEPAAPAPDAPPAAHEPAPAPAEEPAPARTPARPKTNLPPQNGHTAPRLPRVEAQPGNDLPVPRPPLTNLPQSLPYPISSYALDEEAEDLSQLLGNVAEQTVLALATRGQRGVERRERMASKIDAFSQDMSADPNLAPVVAYLESISALLRAGKPIPAAHALVDPFDGLYDYVLTLIQRKTGKTLDEQSG